MSSIDGKDDDDGVFNLDNYGVSLQPAMTKELEERINRSVNEAYNNIKSYISNQIVHKNSHSNFPPIFLKHHFDGSFKSLFFCIRS